MWKKVLIGIGSVLLILFIALFAIFGTGRYGAQEAQQEPLALINGHFITMSADTPEVISDKALLLRNGEISGFRAPDQLPADIKTVDLKGGYAMPGLMDLHVHLGALPIIEDLSMVNLILEYGRRYPQSRKKFLEYGVTTIQSLGDPHPRITGLGNKIANNELAGPRIFAAGPILTAPGGHPVSTIYEGNSWLIENATRQLEDTSRARKVVKNLNRDGVDKIKVVYSAGPDSTLPRMEYEVLNVIVQEAHQQDLRVVAHISSRYDINDVLEAGADGIEHIAHQMDDSPALLNKMADEDFYVVPTMAVYKSFMDSTAFQNGLDTFADWLDHDIDVALGTDTGNIPAGESVYTEMELYAKAGMDPYDILKSATIEAARHIRAADRLGTLESGKEADLIVFEQNPLKNIGDLNKPSWVFRDGVSYFNPK